MHKQQSTSQALQLAEAKHQQVTARLLMEQKQFKTSRPQLQRAMILPTRRLAGFK